MAITVTHSKVSTIPDGDDSSLIRPSDWNDSHVISGTVPVANGGTGASTLTGYVKGNGTSTMTASSTIPNTDITGLGTMSTQNSNNISVTGGSISGTTVSGYIPTSAEGVANGVATLDSGGTVPLSQIPASIIGGLNYQGSWNASTNTPTLTSSVGTKGYYYVVSVAGTTNLNGITDWQVGDLAVFNGSVWQKIDNTDAVTSVNGYTGAVVLTYSDVGAANAPVNTNITSMTGITGGISTADYVTFDTTYATTLTAGQLGWDGNNTLAIGMAGGNVIQHIGEDSFFYIKASSAITKGQLVMFTGAVGASGVLTGAPSTGVTNPQYIMGVAAENIALNGFGLIQWFGEITGVNTNAFNEGDVLYYDSAVTGGLTNVYPTSGIIVTVAAVAKKSAGGGVLYVRVSVTDRITASTGISVSQNGTGTSITNTAPDQTVAIASGTGISVTGTYPNFTVTNTSPSSGGTVTSVDVSGGTTGLTTSGGPVTSSGTITLAGTLGLANGGTGKTTAPAAMANLMGFTSTATAAGTTTLTNTSSYYQVFTGSTTQTVVLPVTSTLQTGWTFHICNNSTGALTVNSSGGNLVISVIAGTTVMVTCIGTTLTTAADWEAGYTDFSTATGTGAVVLATSPSISSPSMSNPTATGILSFTGTTSSSASFATSQTTSSTTICTSQTLGTLTVGGTAQTGTMTLGRSTVSQQTDIQAGATTTGNTKTINLGTGGLSGSTTTMAIGSAVAGSTTNVTANGTWTFSTPMAATNMTQATTSTSGYLSSTDWNTFNNKGSGSVNSVSGTGTVSGITLSGTVTSSGSLTLGGTLDLSAPPAIGGTTPNAITGTTITATKFVGVSGGTF